MKILIVDDDEFTLQTIAHVLKKDKHTVLTANDGISALDLIEKENIDLLISDVLMPYMSGLGLLSLTKQFYSNTIPVILISSLNKADAILSKLKLDLGEYDFLEKPLNFDELLIKVNHLEKK